MDIDLVRLFSMSSESSSDVEIVEHRNQIVESQNLIAEQSKMARTDVKLDLKICELASDNYVTWSWQAKNVLRANNLESAISSDADIERSNKALALLGGSLNLENQRLVCGCTTAKELWERLQMIYENKTSFENQELLRSLHSYKIRSASDVIHGLSEIQTLASRVKIMGESISDDALMAIIMNALPDIFQHFLTSFQLLSPDVRTLQHLISNVSAQARQLTSKVEEEVALAAQSKPSASTMKREGKCNFCKKEGHWKFECKKLQRKQASSNNQSQQAESKTVDDDEKPVSFMAVEDPDATSEEWVADSGSSHHMTNNKDWLRNYTVFERPKQVKLGNNDKLAAIGHGIIETNFGSMSLVYFVPLLVVNLFSISAATASGLVATYTNDKFELSKDGKRVLEGRRSNGIYKLLLSIVLPEVHVTMDIKDWHRAYGHVSTNTIQTMKQHNCVIGLNIGNRTPACEDCAIAKCKNVSHPSRSSAKASKPGLVLHFDLVGPMNPLSLGKSKYFILCRDEFSSYRLVEFVQTKEEVTSRVQLIINRVELEVTRPLKIVSDNGSEFKNSILKEFLNQRSITQEFSAPHAPQQNGYVERDIRTITECARSILSESKLPKSLWAEAVNTAVYVQNRCINTRSGLSTPYQLWSGKTPDVSNFHIFGEPVIVKKTGSLKKWDDKGVEGRFVGYTQNFNTFRVFKSKEYCVISTCNVVSNIDTQTSEQVIPNEPSTSVAAISSTTPSTSNKAPEINLSDNYNNTSVSVVQRDLESEQPLSLMPIQHCIDCEQIRVLTEADRLSHKLHTNLLLLGR